MQTFHQRCFYISSLSCLHHNGVIHEQCCQPLGLFCLHSTSITFFHPWALTGHRKEKQSCSSDYCWQWLIALCSLNSPWRIRANEETCVDIFKKIPQYLFRQCPAFHTFREKTKEIDSGGEWREKELIILIEEMGEASLGDWRGVQCDWRYSVITWRLKGTK